MSRIAIDLANGHHNSQLEGTNPMFTALRTATGKMPRIAIVGAGMSGLRCADLLIRSGADATIFEARDRIGGRVHQIESGKYLMDMGPNWIHGTNGNPIQKLAEKTRTVLLEPEEEAAAVFDYDGIRKSDDEAAELAGTVWGMIVNAFKFSDENTAEIDPNTSLFDYFKKDLSQKVRDRRKLADLLEEAHMWGPIIGDPIERQSLKFFFLEECIDGENVFVAGTYKDILKEVSRTALESQSIRLNHEVKAFDIREQDGEGESCVSISLANGEQHTYDEVVITTPLGWLKRNYEKAFTPALPPRLSQAINNISYGRLEKLYVTFPSAFWLENPTSNDSSSTSNSDYPIFSRFYNPTYVPHPSDEPWNQSIFSLANLPKSVAHPTLLFYIYGPCATSIVSKVKGLTPHSTSYNSVLDSFAHPFYRLLPNYSPTESKCIPTTYLMTQWQNDRFAGNGSYCNFQIGLKEGDKDIEVMRDAGGLTEKGLWMAGEHTAPFIALGTTTGAYWSGEGVARRICKKYGLKVLDDTRDSVDEDSARRKEPKVENADAANLNGIAF